MSEATERRRRTRLPAEDRQRQVLDVATRLIAERGYWGMSLREVASACGVSLGAVLHHFSSKDALLLAVLAHRDRLDIAALEDVFGPVTAWLEPPRVTLAALCAAIVARNAEQPEIVRLYSVLAAEALDPRHPAHDHFADRQRNALAGLALFAPAGCDADAAAARALALMDGLQLQWLRDPSRDWLADWRRATAGMAELRPD